MDNLTSSMQDSPLSPSLLAELLNTSSKAFQSAMAMATSQAGPIVTSILVPPITKAETLIKQTCNPSPNLRSLEDWNKLWQRSSYLLTSKHQEWPTRKHHSINKIFKSVTEYKEWSVLTGKYFIMKASSECDEFLPKKTLHNIGIKDKDGIWKARHRLFEATQAHPALNISGEPFLIESRSPLAWSIALFVHNKVAPAPFLTRPSTTSHKHWKDCHRNCKGSYQKSK